MAGVTVSEDLGRHLDHLAGVPLGKQQEALRIEAKHRAHQGGGDGDFCIWSAGCYYCRSRDGRWILIECVA
jgi:hypothetical protein